MNKYIFHTMMLSACVWCSGCDNKQTNISTSLTESRQASIQISVVEVTEGVLLKELVLNGEVTCDESRLSKIYLPCSGKVSGITIEVGDHVKCHQQLATIDSQEAADYHKELSMAERELQLSERECNIIRDMHKGGLASDKQLAEAESSVTVAKAECERLSRVARVRGFSESTGAVLKAPIEGYIISKNIHNGTYVDDNTTDLPAFEIADLQTVWVVADVYERDIRLVSQGEKVRLRVLAYSDEPISGEIDKIYKSLDADSKTMKVRIRLTNDDGKLLPGMFANVFVTLRESGCRLAEIPSHSVIFENGRHYVVLALEEGKFQRREVTVAHQDERRTLISQGIKVGDKVVDKNALLEYNALK